jgi:hypothetical protein
MFIVVTVKAQQFPVTSVGGIVVVIMIAVMHGEFRQIGAGKLALTAATDPRIKFQGLFAISLGAFVLMATGIADDFLECVIF